MTGTNTIDIAIVGLGFGRDFIPIYADHPNVGAIGIVEPSAERLAEVGNRYGIEHRYAALDEVLAEDRWDAVHILAPVSFHAEYSLAVLRAGKHCACAVPMATELDDLSAIIRAQEESGRRYMMMETSVYGREYLAVEEMYREGGMGQLTLYRGYHMQNLDGYPPYWRGYPPMKYVTHALSPILALTQSSVVDVTAYGTGTLTEDRMGPFDNTYPAEAGLFRLSHSDVVADITMSFFQTARSYIEGFSVYGDKVGVEWPDVEGEPPRMFELRPLGSNQPTTGLRGRRAHVSDLHARDFTERLPESLARYVREFTVTPAGGGQPMTFPAAHGGSHPYLVHEFISSIVDGRRPAIDAITSAAWTAPGICAHESALRGGERVAVPSFVPSPRGSG